MSKNFINLWDEKTRVWNRHAVPADWSYGQCILIAELIRTYQGFEAYAEGDLIGELAAKAGISRASAEIEYERPEWAA